MHETEVAIAFPSLLCLSETSENVGQGLIFLYRNMFGWLCGLLFL